MKNGLEALKTDNNGMEAWKTSPTPLQLLIREMPGEKLPSLQINILCSSQYSGTYSVASVACCVKVWFSVYSNIVQYITIHTYVDIAEYVLNKCVTQAGEDHPVKYNFDILEDQDSHEHHALVWMVSNHNSETVWKEHKGTFVLN